MCCQNWWSAWNTVLLKLRWNSCTQFAPRQASSCLNFHDSPVTDFICSYTGDLLVILSCNNWWRLQTNPREQESNEIKKEWPCSKQKLSLMAMANRSYLSIINFALIYSSWVCLSQLWVESLYTVPKKSTISFTSTYMAQFLLQFLADIIICSSDQRVLIDQFWISFSLYQLLSQVSAPHAQLYLAHLPFSSNRNVYTSTSLVPRPLWRKAGWEPGNEATHTSTGPNLTSNISKGIKGFLLPSTYSLQGSNQYNNYITPLS